MIRNAKEKEGDNVQQKQKQDNKKHKKTSEKKTRSIMGLIRILLFHYKMR
jgi:hypothetical protein